MHVELVEIFRCVAPHRDSWLVAAADRTEGRTIIDGTLGCPVCHAEYAIENGVVRFDVSSSPGRESRQSRPRESAPIGADELHDDDQNEALRLAAMLGASEATMTIALLGVSLRLAVAVQSIASVRCIVVDPPDERDALDALQRADSQLAIVRATGVLPVAQGALHGVYANRRDVSVYVHALRRDGRLVAPANAPMPAGITELAHDERHWVGERSAETSAAPASLVQLRRRR
jgi:hypothetical protein